MPRIPGTGSSKQAGVVTFAGVLFLLVGSFNLVDGLVALLNPDFFRDTLLFSNLDVWGAYFLAFGALQVIVGAAILNRSKGGQFAGLLLAFFNAISHLAFIVHFPAWSLTILALDMVIIYALTVHGDEFE